MKNLKTSLILILFLLISTTVSIAQTSCTSCSTNNCSSVSMTFSYNGITRSYPNIPWISGMNVRVAILSANQQSPFSYTTTNYCPYGGYLVSYNGYYSGSSSYWALYINGRFANYGMDFQQLKAGDQVQWVLTNYSTIKKDAKEKSHQTFLAAEHIKRVLTAKE